MTTKELLKFAKTGIESEIEHKCGNVADSWASPDSIAALKKPIAQYDEVVEKYEAARKEEEAD